MNFSFFRLQQFSLWQFSRQQSARRLAWALTCAALVGVAIVCVWIALFAKAPFAVERIALVGYLFLPCFAIAWCAYLFVAVRGLAQSVRLRWSAGPRSDEDQERLEARAFTSSVLTDVAVRTGLFAASVAVFLRIDFHGFVTQQEGRSALFGNWGAFEVGTLLLLFQLIGFAMALSTRTDRGGQGWVVSLYAATSVMLLPFWIYAAFWWGARLEAVSGGVDRLNPLSWTVIGNLMPLGHVLVGATLVIAVAAFTLWFALGRRAQLRSAKVRDALLRASE